MLWSYSRIEIYESCPHEFLLTYLMQKHPCDNAFSQFGILIHGILQRYLEGKLEIWNVLHEYESQYYLNVINDFPYSKTDLNESYYHSGYEYFRNFVGFEEDWNVLAVERKFITEIQSRKWTGVIDAVFDGKDGIVIMDHKSKNGFKSKKEKQRYLRQLYLYSIWVKEQYGEYPSKLCFNLFRKRNIVLHDFRIDELKEAIDWQENVIQSIYQDSIFYRQTSEFYCRNLCGMRHICKKMPNE